VKLHPELTPQIIVEMMLNPSAEPPRPLDHRASDVERANELEKMQEIVVAGGVRFMCTGCGDPVTVEDAMVCVCGGFVCPACRRTEEDDVCLHEPPDYPEAP
jgi:hypothetical protein